MEQRGLLFHSLNNPVPEQLPVHYRNNPSDEQISDRDQPPPYHSLFENTNSSNIYIPNQPKETRSCRCGKRRAIIVVGLLIILMIFLLILFTVILKGISCDKPSNSGKSCRQSLRATNVELLRISTAVKPTTWGGMSFSRSEFKYFSSSYVGISNSDVITFTFEKGFDWYVDDISVIDTLTSMELITNGGFETGSVNTYCVCPASFGSPSSTTSLYKNSGSYGFDSSNFFGETKLSQVLDTIPGRSYVVSFTLYNTFGSQMTVHMSDTNQNCVSAILLLISLLVVIIQTDRLFE